MGDDVLFIISTPWSSVTALLIVPQEAVVRVAGLGLSDPLCGE